jgi:ribosomal protein S18 acetylase RimI-like enzyme
MVSEARWLVPSIGLLAAAERPRTVDVLARAFRDNPLNVAVVGARDARRRLRSNAFGTRTLLPVAEVHGEVWVARKGERVVAALIGTPPHAYPLPPPPLAARLRCLVGQGWRVARRWAEVFQALDALHPAEPHWYLGTLGVDPDHQGRGAGTALLRHWLARTAGDVSGAYLETDVRDNVGFYDRQGFAVERETRVLGVRVWCMRRPPATR